MMTSHRNLPCKVHLNFRFSVVWMRLWIMIKLHVQKIQCNGSKCMNTCTRAILGQTQKYASEYASKFGSPYCTVVLRAPYGTSHFEGEGCEASILVVLNYRIKICEPPQTNVMCAGPQGSDPLTISDKVPGIFRIKEISISPTDPPILIFRVNFDLCHHGGEADKREILC